MDNTLLDKIVLYVMCIAIYLMNVKGYYAVVPMLAVVVFAALGACINEPYFKIGLFVGFAILCLLFPQFTLFLPVMAYDIPIKYWRWSLLSLIPVLVSLTGNHIATGLLLSVLLALGAVIKYRTYTLEKTMSEYIDLCDTTKELSMHLSEKNKELLEKQDYETRVATLNERNRIARDIHDSVGHILSSAILQTGALMAICGDSELKKKLKTVKETLSQGMDNIRKSVHELYDESIDLNTEIIKLIKKFKFCPVALEYNVDSEPGRKLKYAFLAVISEALSNVAKHSNANAVNIALNEHPVMFQLVIKDNGTEKDVSDGSGIGLANIKNRIADLGGILNIDSENGFKIFITVPKECSHI